MTGLLRRVGGVLLAPRAAFAGLSPGTGRHDGAALFAAYMLAVGVPALGDAIADFWALLSLAAAPGLLRALLPALPWLVTLTIVEWLLGPARAWRAALCLVPLLTIDALAHALALAGLAPAWPEFAPATLGGLASLLLAARARPAIAPEPEDLSRKTADLSAKTAPADLSPGTADLPPKTAPSDLSPGTADLSAKTAPADLSPGTAVLPPRTAPSDLPPGTADLPPKTAPSDLPPGTADLPPRTAPSAGPALALGAVLAALVAATGGAALTRLVQRWPTLAPVAHGDPLPGFSAPLLDGGALRSADLRGAPHLLIFWTTWCGVCRGEMPMYRALADRYRERGLVVIAVAADRDGDVPALVRAYRDEHRLPFPIALDSGGAVTRSFRVKMYPHLVLVDADGQIRDVRQGRTSESGLAAAIEAVLPPT